MVFYLTQLLVDFAATKFADKIGYRTCVVASQVVSAVGLVLMAILPDMLPVPFIGILISVVLYAIGSGLVEVLVSPIVEACPFENKDGVMSLLHSFYCWGAMGVILGSTLFFSVAGVEHWKILTFIWALVPLYNTFNFINCPIERLVEDGKSLGVCKLLKTPIFWLIILLLVLDLVDKGMVTDQIVLTVGYDIENLSDPVRRKAYKGQITTDRYGRQVPKHAHGTANIGRYTSSTRLVTDAVLELYDRIVDKSLLVRRLNISANHVICEADVPKENKVEQLDLFTDYAALEKEKEKENAALEREKKMQQAVLTIKKKFGKNAILKGMNLQEGATAKDRNAQIGGHKA